MAFGVMGGPMQAQGHVQIMSRVFDYGLNPQSAADAPRWMVASGNTVCVENFSADVLDELRRRGHDIQSASPDTFGGAQLIYKMDDCYVAASEPRKDGQAVGY